MKRLIGIKSKNATPKPAPPGISDCISIVDKRADEAEKKAAKCELDLKKLKDQIKNTRPGPAQNALKQKAMRVMQQWKTYQGQADTLRQQSFGMDQTTTALQSATETQVIISAMKSGAKELQKKLDQTTVEEIEGLQDNMAELLETSGEIQEALTPAKYNTPEIDDDELQAQFDALGDEIAADSGSADLHDSIFTGPSSNVPSVNPGMSTNTVSEEPGIIFNGIMVDEFGLPNLPTHSLAEQLHGK